MAEPIDHNKCRILISNDDGIASPGIKVLEKVARELSNDVWVVAPEQEQSGASHSLTTRRPLRLRPVGEQRYAVDGTPTDCVLLAVKRLLHLPWPDHTLFNINFPGVVAEEVSGFAVTHQGKRAIADNLTEGVDPRGRPYYWIGPIRETRTAEPGTDVCALSDDKVSITPIYLDLTNIPVLNALRKVFE